MEILLTPILISFIIITGLGITTILVFIAYISYLLRKDMEELR